MHLTKNNLVKLQHTIEDLIQYADTMPEDRKINILREAMGNLMGWGPIDTGRGETSHSHSSRICPICGYKITNS
jgi:hypothetical protein